MNGLSGHSLKKNCGEVNLENAKAIIKNLLLTQTQKVSEVSMPSDVSDGRVTFFYQILTYKQNEKFAVCKFPKIGEKFSHLFFILIFFFKKLTSYKSTDIEKYIK